MAKKQKSRKSKAKLTGTAETSEASQPHNIGMFTERHFVTYASTEFTPYMFKLKVCDDMEANPHREVFGECTCVLYFDPSMAKNICVQMCEALKRYEDEFGKVVGAQLPGMPE